MRFHRRIHSDAVENKLSDVSVIQLPLHFDEGVASQFGGTTGQLIDSLMKSQRKHGDDFLSLDVLDKQRRCEILTSVHGAVLVTQSGLVVCSQIFGLLVLGCIEGKIWK